MDENFNFLLSLGIDVGNAIPEWEAFYKEMRAKMEKPIEVSIKPEMDLKGLKGEVEQLVTELKKVTEALTKTEQEMEQVEKETTEAAGKLEKVFPKAADKLKEAFAKGEEAAKEAVQNIVAEYKKLGQVDPKKLVLEATGGDAEKADRVIKLLQKILKERQELVKLKEDVIALEQSGENPRNAEALRRNLEAGKRTHAKRPGQLAGLVGDDAVAASLYTTFRNIEKGQVGVQRDDRDVQAAVQGYLQSLGRHAGVAGQVSAGRMRAAELLGQLNAYGPAARGALGGGVGGGPGGGIGVGVDLKALQAQLENLDIKIDAKKVHGQLQAYFASNPFRIRIDLKEAGKEVSSKVKVGVHQTFLRNSINEVLRDSGKLAKLRVKVHEPVLLASIRDALKALKDASAVKLILGVNKTNILKELRDVAAMDAAKLPKLKLGIHQPFFINQIHEAIRAAEAANLSVNVNAFTGDLTETMKQMAASAGAAAEAIRKSGIVDPAFLRQRREEDRLAAAQRRVDERREERAGMVSKKQTRRMAKEDPLTFLQSQAPELVAHARKIMGVYDPNISIDERGRRSKEALDVIPQFVKAINDKERSLTLTEGQKEHFKVFGESFAAKFITNLEARARQVRDNGPRSNPTGALAGVDHNAAEIAKAEWMKAVEELRRGVSNFAATRTDFGQETYRDRQAEKAKAYKNLLNQMVKWENAVATLQDARTDKERLIAKKRVEGAQQEYKFSEQILRNRLLADKKGEIYTPVFDPTQGAFTHSTKMGYAAAASTIQAGLEQALGGDLAGINAKLMAGGGAGMNMGTFLHGLTGGPEFATLQKEFLKLRGVTDAVLNDEKAMTAELEKQLGPLRDVFKVHEIIEALLRKEIADVHKQEAAQAKLKASLLGYRNTLRNAMALFGGFGIGYTAAYALRNEFNRVTGFEKEIAGIQGVLKGKNSFDAKNLAGGIGQVAQKYGMDLLETAQAARVLAQSGYEANEVIRALDKTMSAARGMGMTIEQVQNLQVAVRAVTAANENFNQSVDYTSAVLDKISDVEARYAVNGRDLAEALTILGPVAEQLGKDMTGVGDSFDYVIGMSTVLVERLRITGTQAGNLLKVALARLGRPEVLKKVQDKFGVQIEDAATGDYLPIDRLMAELGQKYQQLGQKPDGGVLQKQFATLLGGGRNLNSMIALLENYTRVQQIAFESNQAFGGASERSAIGLETMDAAVKRVRTSITLFSKNMFEATGFAAGLKDILNSLANLLAGLNGQGGGLGTLLTLVLGGGAAISAGKGLFGLLSAAAKGGGAAFTMKTMAESAKGLFSIFTAGSGVLGRTAGLFGLLARIFTPGGILIAGITTAISLWGYLSHRHEEAAKELEKYKVKLRDLSDLQLDASPQYQGYKTIAEDPRFKLGTLENAQQLALKAMQDGLNSGLGQQYAGLEPILKDFENASLKGQNTAATWAKNNSAEIQRFQKEFQRIFLESLPESVRKGFESIKDSGERSAEVTKYIAGAAFSATYQMKAAIEDLNAATKRMFDDTIKNLQRMDAESKKNDFFHRMFGSNESSKPFAGGNFAETLARVYKKDPLISAFLQNQTLRGAADKAGGAELTRLAGQGREATNADLLAAFLELVSTDKELSQVAAAVTAQATGNVDALRQFSDVVLQKAGINKYTDPVLRSQAALEGIRATGVQSAQQEVERNNPFLASMERVMKLFGFVQPGATKLAPTDDALKHARDGLIQFKDKLLDVVLEIYKSVERFKQQESFATRYGTSFNREQGIQEIAKRLLETYDTSRVDLTAEIAALYRKAETNASSGGLHGEPKADAQIQAQREELQRDLNRFVTETIPAVLGTSEAGQTIASTLKDFFDRVAEGVVEFNQDTLRAALEQAGGAAFSQSRARVFTQQRGLQNLEIDRNLLSKRQEVAEAELSVTTKLGPKLALRQQYAAATLKADLQILDTRAKLEGMDENQVRLAAEKLATEYQLGQALDARLESAKAEQALQQQTMTNLRGMTAGFRNLFTNTSIWEQILNPEGDDPEAKAQAKAQAIAQVIFNTFGSVSDTILDRIAENMQAKLVDVMMQSDFLTSIAGGPETGLQESVWQANASQMTEVWKTDLLDIANQMGDIWSAKLGLGRGNTTAMGTTGYGTVSGMKGGMEALLTGKSGGVPLSDEQKKKMREQLLSGGGVLLGNTLGAVVGGGSKGAQFGSSLGSVGGAALAGKFLGKSLGSFAGPLGGVVGGVLGGAIFGGLFGGKKKAPKEPVQKTLEAIERLQKETITTIQAQTDALLKPENRFLNLPSQFTVPAYNPGFVGGGNGAGMFAGPQVIDNRQIKVELNVNGGDVKEVQRVVQDTVGEMLYNDRRSRKWG